VVIWIAFLSFILVLLALDLGIFHRRAHVVSVREAGTWTVVWIATALAFAVFVYFGYDQHWLGLGLQPDPVDRSPAYPDGRVNDARSAVLKFLTGYVVELSLSADNVFVIAMLFSYFGIPRMYQHRVLFWGILGALVMRGAMIAIGARLVSEFSWILSVFGAILILTAGKMVFMGAETGDPEQKFAVRMMRRFLPTTNQYHGERFVVKTSGVWKLTPLAPALVMVETTDLVFAVDSIPAVFAITADPFLVFTSNVFAILGLRSLYFALAGALHLFKYLKHALAVVLLTVGVKMLAHSWFERVLGPNFNLYLLAAVITILAIGVIISLIELRWHDQIRGILRNAPGRLRQRLAPDELISTIAKAGEEAVSSNAPFVQSRRAQRLWRRLFRANTLNIPILAAHQIALEADIYATSMLVLW